MVAETFTWVNIVKLIIAIILGYGILFFFMWLFRAKDKKDNKK